MRDGPGTILVGVDGSTSSLRAGAYALGLARRQGSRLVVVYVRTLPSALLPLADTGGAIATVIDTQDAVERELREAFAERIQDLGLDARLVVRAGEPYTELCDAARQVRADAVIVGRSANVLHRVAGSIGSKLVRCGRWPVTVVP
ncbi:universal stress protein [Actinoplanes sp. M2I2]|uniref:universal stress protein n=1 Tax=Actinoplanes sp. M2I2 TaxID=1734444 RepID=UPI002021735D|nr:universal stress protein [Actinoplanes sp. M2I2]